MRIRWKCQHKLVSKATHPLFAQSGLTIIELLVSLGVLSILLALLLPAVQMARESARKSTCGHHLHQIGTALEAFESTRGRYPAGSVQSLSSKNRLTNNISPHVELLPYLGQLALFEAFNPSEDGAGIKQDPPFSNVNTPMLSRRLEVFTCPSDVIPGAACNYRVSSGTSPWMHSTRPKISGGALQGFRSLKGRRDSEFVDGKSNTTAFAEKLAGDHDVTVYTPWRDLLSIRVGSPGLLRPDDAMTACDRPANSNPKHFSFGGSTWVLSGYPQTWYNHVLPPNAAIPDCVDGGPMGHGAFTARSLHLGGVNVLFADGGIRFTSNMVDLDVWRSLGTIAGGELVFQQ